MTKKSRQKLKYLENEKSIGMKQKAFFINFKGLSVAKNCLRPESAPLSMHLLLEKIFPKKLKSPFMV